MKDDTPDPLDEIRFCMALNVRYHERRERWLDGWDRLAKAIAVIGGAATVSTLLATTGSPASLFLGVDVKAWIAALITVTSTLSLVFDFPGKARRHYDLRKKYLALEAEMTEATNPEPRRFMSRIAMLEVEEPPRLSTLVQMCHNEIAQSRGEQLHPVPLWKALLANLLDLPAKARRDPAAT